MLYSPWESVTAVEDLLVCKLTNLTETPGEGRLGQTFPGNVTPGQSGTRTVPWTMPDVEATDEPQPVRSNKASTPGTSTADFIIVSHSLLRRKLKKVLCEGGAEYRANTDRLSVRWAVQGRLARQWVRVFFSHVLYRLSYLGTS